jgi:hypothetical protein
MKTILSFLLAALGSAAMAQPSVEVQSVRGYPGQTATVPFAARRATNLVAAQFDLAYAPAHGTVLEPELAARHSNHVVRSRAIAPGVRRVLVYSRANAEVRTNGFSGAFGFSVPAGERAGSGPITPRNVVLARGDGTALTPVSARSGAVFVTPVYRDPESGMVNLFFPSADQQNYSLQATTDFQRWETLATKAASGDFLEWVDADAPRYPHRYYRTVWSEALGRLGEVALLPDGRVSVHITGLVGRQFTVQTSTNLIDWLDAGIVTTAGGGARFTNAPAQGTPQRFFRLTSR